jgi:hypothetical protein
MNKIQEPEFKKVSGQVFDPFRDSPANNVFNNINISDQIASSDDLPINQLVHKSRNLSANQRTDKEIRYSLRDLS